MPIQLCMDLDVRRSFLTVIWQRSEGTQMHSNKTRFCTDASRDHVTKRPWWKSVTWWLLWMETAKWTLWAERWNVNWKVRKLLIVWCVHVLNFYVIGVYLYVLMVHMVWYGIYMYSVSVSMYKCDTISVYICVHLWVWLVCRWVCLMWLCAVWGTSVTHTKDLRARVVANTILFLFISQETDGAVYVA